MRTLEARVKELEQQLATAHQRQRHNTSNELPSPPVAGDSPQMNASTLATELKRLSLEATAERHLGPSSGLSFAKLTQAVLRRLCPDQEAFVFAHEAEGEREAIDEVCWDSGMDWSGLGMGIGSVASPTALDYSLVSALDGIGDGEIHGADPLPSVLGASPVITDANDLALFDVSHIKHLLNFYFCHSHTLYPIIRQHEFTRVLWQLYANPHDPLAQSPLWLMRIWMVLAIGSTAYSSVALDDESESMRLFSKAMTHFEAVMGYGDLVGASLFSLSFRGRILMLLSRPVWKL